MKPVVIRPRMRDMMFKYSDNPIAGCAMLIAQVKHNKRNLPVLGSSRRAKTAEWEKQNDDREYQLYLDRLTEQHNTDLAAARNQQPRPEGLDVVYYDYSDPKLNNTFSSQGINVASSLSEPEPEPDAV